MAVIIGTTVIMEISKYVDLLWIFMGMGLYSIAIALFLIFGIKDVITEKTKKAKNAN